LTWIQEPKPEIAFFVRRGHSSRWVECRNLESFSITIQMQPLQTTEESIAPDSQEMVDVTRQSMIEVTWAKTAPSLLGDALASGAALEFRLWSYRPAMRYMGTFFQDESAQFTGKAKVSELNPFSGALLDALLLAKSPLPKNGRTLLAKRHAAKMRTA
jgi:hypothetical protein